jgi:hypothetical protein
VTGIESVSQLSICVVFKQEEGKDVLVKGSIQPLIGVRTVLCPRACLPNLSTSLASPKSFPSCLLVLVSNLFYFVSFWPMAPCRARVWRSLCPFFLLNVLSSTGPSVSLFLEQLGVRIRANHRRTAKVSIPRSSPPAHNAIDRKAGPTFSSSLHSSTKGGGFADTDSTPWRRCP